MEFFGLKPVQIVTERLTQMGEAILNRLPHLALGLFILILTWLLAALVRRATKRIIRGSAERRSLRSAIQKLVTIGIWVTGIAVTATVIFPTIKPSDLLAGLGLGSVAVGFAFKDIFESFFAGMLILFRQPYRIGD